MRMSDIQDKNIINLSDGSFLGNIIDAEISSDGKVVKFIIYNRGKFMGILKGKEEVSINWNQIKKIGTDTILVDKNL